MLKGSGGGALENLMPKIAAFVRRSGPPQPSEMPL